MASLCIGGGEATAVAIEMIWCEIRGTMVKPDWPRLPTVPDTVAGLSHSEKIWQNSPHVGANRGLGLEFAKQYAADGCNVIATCRRPAEAAELRRVGVSIEALDTSTSSIEALAVEADR